LGRWLVANWPDHGGDPSSGHTSSTGTAHHQTELNSLLDILLAANLDLPTRGSRVSWDDFFWGWSGQVWGMEWELEASNKRGKHTALRADDMVGYVRKQKGGCRKGIACAARKGKEEGEGATLLRFST
jgi:hypothetical protein